MDNSYSAVDRPREDILAAETSEETHLLAEGRRKVRWSVAYAGERHGALRCLGQVWRTIETQYETK